MSKAATAKTASKKPAPTLQSVVEVEATRKPTSSANGAALASLAAAIKSATKQTPAGYYSGTIPHIPTGLMSIDVLLGGELTEDKSGLICPGLPRGRIGEVYGAESSGKTTLACQFISKVQRDGGTALFLDFENTLHHGYAKAIGVDFSPDKLLIYSPDTFEEGVKMIYMAAAKKIDLIVIDSVSAMIPVAEMTRKIDDAAKVGALASAMSRFLPKMAQWLHRSGSTLVMINQTRSLISSHSYGGDNDNTSGGKALKFYCSFRLKTTRIRSDFVERKDAATLKKKKIPYGNMVQVKCVKNKIVGHQNHTAEIFIRFGCGVDEQLSLIESAIPRRLITKTGSMYSIGGETFRGKDRLRKYLVDNPKVANDIRDKVMRNILDSAPATLEGDDEIEDDDIVSDMRREMGDDDLFDDDDVAPAEEIIEDPTEES